MSNPKMGNNYPGALSTYPSWVAHETPYTAEWGNSVGYEFYLIEYELGVAPRGTYNSVSERIEALEVVSGFNYFTWAYLRYNQLRADNTDWQKVDIDGIKIDEGGMWDSVNKIIKIKVAGWYEIIGNLVFQPKDSLGASTHYFMVKRNTETEPYVRQLKIEVGDEAVQDDDGLGVSIVIHCDVDDYFALWHRQSPSLQTNYRLTNDGTFMSVRMIKRD